MAALVRATTGSSLSGLACIPTKQFVFINQLGRIELAGRLMCTSFLSQKAQLRRAERSLVVVIVLVLAVVMAGQSWMAGNKRM